MGDSDMGLSVSSIKLFALIRGVQKLNPLNLHTDHWFVSVAAALTTSSPNICPQGELKCSSKHEKGAKIDSKSTPNRDKGSQKKVKREPKGDQNASKAFTWRKHIEKCACFFEAWGTFGAMFHDRSIQNK